MIPREERFSEFYPEEASPGINDSQYDISQCIDLETMFDYLNSNSEETLVEGQDSSADGEIPSDGMLHDGKMRITLKKVGERSASPVRRLAGV